MKKVLLTALSVIVASSIFGQRNVDLSVESILEPSIINSNTSTGTQFSVLAVIKNNSATDSILVGDTLIFQVAILNSTSNPLVATNVLFRINAKTILPGDTQHLRYNFTWNQYFINSFSAKLLVFCIAANRPSLTYENTANNTKTKDMDYINPNGFGVNIANVSNNTTVSTYPNPAKDILTIELPTKSVDAVVTTAVITDISGKTILTKEFTFENNLSMDVSTLDNGIYILNVQNGDLTYQSKITIAK